MSEQTQEPEGAQPGADTIAAAVDATAVAGTRPEDFPEDLWDAEANAPKAEAVAARLKELGTAKASLDELAATVVDSPDKIDWNLGLKTDDGADITFDEKDPLFASVAQTFVAEKIPTAYLKPLATAFVQAQMQMDEASRTQLKNEFESLGEKRVERIQSLTHQVAGVVGADAARAFVGNFSSRAQVEVLEKLMAHFAEPNVVKGVPGAAPKSAAEALYPVDPFNPQKGR